MKKLKATLLLTLLFSGAAKTLYAETLYTSSGPIVVTNTQPYISEPVTITGSTNMQLRFEYDTTKLDATPSLDSFSYG